MCRLQAAGCRNALLWSMWPSKVPAGPTWRSAGNGKPGGIRAVVTCNLQPATCTSLHFLQTNPSERCCTIPNTSSLATVSTTCRTDIPSLYPKLSTLASPGANASQTLVSG